MKQKIILLLLTTLSLWGCTRDDICPEDTQTTPLLVIKFMDISNPSQVKAVDNLRITLANTSQTEVVIAISYIIFFQARQHSQHGVFGETYLQVVL